MVAQVAEKLPFDEPLTEYGQQDGELRRRWLAADLAGKSRFEFQRCCMFTEVMNAF